MFHGNGGNFAIGFHSVHGFLHDDNDMYFDPLHNLDYKKVFHRVETIHWKNYIKLNGKKVKSFWK